MLILVSKYLLSHLLDKIRLRVLIECAFPAVRKTIARVPAICRRNPGAGLCVVTKKRKRKHFFVNSKVKFNMLYSQKVFDLYIRWSKILDVNQVTNNWHSLTFYELICSSYLQVNQYQHISKCNVQRADNYRMTTKARLGWSKFPPLAKLCTWTTLTDTRFVEYWID